MRLHGKQAALAFFVGNRKKRSTSTCLHFWEVPASRCALLHEKSYPLVGDYQLNRDLVSLCKRVN
ncbi:MAG TPA: hypothetical protein VKU38_15185, partial [Ktedonobacteraceae bacterium]|nr:hypothetical protein [Ktedonobacteraceae bacterium]